MTNPTLPPGAIMIQASRVVVCVFDGLRPDMVTPDRMPHLAAFIAGGRSFPEARTVFPSMTRVATSSIATGAFPSRHGIVGNAFYYPEVTRDFVLDVSKAEDIALAEERLGGDFLTAGTFADALAEAGKSVAVVHSGSPGSTYAINPRAAKNGHWTFSVLGTKHTRTPFAVEDMVARFGPLPPRTLPRFDEIDYAARIMTDWVIPEMAPDVALVWFNEPDTSFHYRFLGSEETRAVMRRVDDAFGRILEAIRLRPDADDIAVLVASDHGQISSSGEVDLAARLTEAGHPAAMASQRDLSGMALAVTGGNMGEIRVLDGDLERRDRVARWLMAQDFTGMLFTPSDDPVHGSLPGTFSHRLVGLDHGRQPELVYVLRSSLDDDAHGLPGLGLITGSVPVGGGMHGGLNRHELNTVLALGGHAAITPGVHAGAAGVIDIAPTILDLLGVAAPASMQGASLLQLGDQPGGPVETFTAGEGDFWQELTLRRRDGVTFAQHGQRRA